jgi:hypothetical protein
MTATITFDGIACCGAHNLKNDDSKPKPIFNHSIVISQSFHNELLWHSPKNSESRAISEATMAKLMFFRVDEEQTLPITNWISHNAAYHERFGSTACCIAIRISIQLSAE